MATTSREMLDARDILHRRGLAPMWEDTIEKANLAVADAAARTTEKVGG